MAKKGGSAPTPPDPAATAQAQTSSNVSTATANAILNNTNQYTPYGNLTYAQTGTTHVDGEINPKTGQRGPGYEIPSYSATTTLSPDQQKILDSQNRADIGMSDLAADYTGRIADATKTPFSMDGMPAAPVYDEQYRQQQRDAMIARDQPQMDRDRSALETRLTNQGIGIGTEAWKNAMDDYGRSVNDYRLGADVQAGNSAAQVFGLQGQTRDRALSEALTTRNQPINEVAALLGTGGGVQQPSFVNTPQNNMAPTDVAGIYQNDFQNRMAIYQQQQQTANATTGALFGLAGAGLGGWARGGFAV